MRTFFFSTAALLAATSAAHAENSFYVSAAGGLEYMEDEQLTGANAAGQARAIDVSFENGEYFGFAVGLIGKDASYGRLRAEVETSFRQSSVEALALNGVARAVNPTSEVSIAAGMVNVYYDSPQFYDRFRVYGGVGFGVAGVDHEIRYLVANAAATGGNLQILIPSSETTFAYQLIAGVDLAITPRLSFVSDVRYLNAGDLQAERYIGNTIINGVATTSGTLDSVLDADISSYTATFGLRYAF